ncbi:hypothetical protein J7M28_04640 [bacterium]|nr:hypothetical protein [bacterium]
MTFNRYRIMALLIVYFVVGYSAAIAVAPQVAFGNKAWTLVLYISGDNDLSSEALVDLNELEAAMEGVDANVLVLMDQYRNNDTRVFDARYDADGMFNEDIVSEEVALGDVYAGWVGLSELNLADPDTLVHFSQWAVNNYPAERLGLVLWNHGDGWLRALQEGRLMKDICYDGQNSMDVLQLRSALASVSQSTGKTFNLISMDACLMGMVEVAYQVKDYCDVFVASEESVPGDGFDYSFVSEITPGSNLDARQLGAHIVNYYHSSYSDGLPHPSDTPETTMTAVDTSKFDAGFSLAVDNLLELLMASMLQNKSKVYNAYLSSYKMDGYYYYVDFCDFMNSLASQNISEAISSAAYAAVAQHDLLAYHHRSGSGYPFCHGLSVYFASMESGYDERYNGDSGFLTFTADGLWDEFIRSYHNPGSMAPQIEHRPLQDTEAENEPIEVSCFVRSEVPLVADELLLYYSTGAFSRADDDFTPVQLLPGGATDEYRASVPGQPYGIMVSYYISAGSVAGVTVTDPLGAPAEAHSFWVRVDTLGPTITHDPLRDQPLRPDGLEITCLVSDNLGVDEESVVVYYSFGEAPESEVYLDSDGADGFVGAIPGLGLMPGDIISYRLQASDLALVPNTTYLPADGHYSFTIVPPLGSVLIVDDGGPESAGIFQQALESLGYVTTMFDPDAATPPEPFDILVYCLGETSEPVPTYHESLVDYVLSGGRLIIESGDIAYSACFDHPTLLSDLRQNVLHIDDWTADYGSSLALRHPDSFVATIPNVLPDRLDFTGDRIETRDVCAALADATSLYDWATYNGPGVLLYDDNDIQSDGGQVAYFTMAVGYLPDDDGQRTALIENCAYWLSAYITDTTAPVWVDASPETGGYLAPNGTMSFVLQDNGSGVNINTIEISLNGEKISPEMAPDNAVNRVAVSYTPEGGFEPNTRYDIEIRACDFAANCLLDSTYWFVTLDEAAAPPQILAAGFMGTQQVSPGDALSVVAQPVASGAGNFIDSVELLYDGLPLGIYLNDEGLLGDGAAGDGLYSTTFELSPHIPSGQYLLQIIASDANGLRSTPWPQLRVGP